MRAMLPCLPTAPNRGRIRLRLRLCRDKLPRHAHHSLNSLHQNCGPLSQIKYLGAARVLRIVLRRKAITRADVGGRLKTAAPTTRREKWSRTTATHQQNGQTCGRENGSHGTQKPPTVETVVERVVYDPYGKPKFYDGSWQNPSDTSAYDNTILYCGYYFDDESGLYHVRHRTYHPTRPRPELTRTS